jgi:hypothetical protein
VRLPARLLAAGLAAVLGFVGYFGCLMFTGAVGPVVAVHPLPWLVLRTLAVGRVLGLLSP